MISIKAHAQEGQDQSSTVNTENPDNFKSPLIQEIVSIPVQQAEDESFFSWNKALLQVGYGQSFFRFNPLDSQNESISTFSDGGYDLNLRAQYYFFSFFSILIDYEFTYFNVERFDGQTINQSQRMARSLGQGIQFDIGDFIIGILFNQWNKPYYQLQNSQLLEGEYQTSVNSYKIGHRTGVKNVILELFYFYHDINSFEIPDSNQASGQLQTLGIEIYFNTKKTFGLHFAETFGNLKSDVGKLEVKQLKIQPFYRF